MPDTVLPAVSTHLSGPPPRPAQPRPSPRRGSFRRGAAAALACAATLAGIDGCASHTAPHSGATSSASPAATTALGYLRAWLIKPSHPDVMCAAELPQIRPNFAADGGTLHGCVAAYRDDFAHDLPEAGRAPLAFTIGDEQTLPAAGGHPAGTGVLATGHRAGQPAFRYALRLVQRNGLWKIAQVADVDPDRYGQDADPVAAVLGQP